jgi:hypothetical protein
MKFRIFVIIAIAFLLSGTTIGAENNLSVKVIHDYVIQNKGATTLEIQKVKTD